MTETSIKKFVTLGLDKDHSSRREKTLRLQCSLSTSLDATPTLQGKTPHAYVQCLILVIRNEGLGLFYYSKFRYTCDFLKVGQFIRVIIATWAIVLNVEILYWLEGVTTDQLWSLSCLPLLYHQGFLGVLICKRILRKDSGAEGL